MSDHPSHGFVWTAECQRVGSSEKGVVRWKFAFQWCEEQGLPWWCPQGSILSHLPCSRFLRLCLPALQSFQPTFVDRSNELGQDEDAYDMTDSDVPLKSLALISDMELRWAKRAKKFGRGSIRKLSRECNAIVYSGFLSYTSTIIAKQT